MIIEPYLAPCPFCGGKVKMKETTPRDRTLQHDIFQIFCPDCKARGPLSEHSDLTVSQWNSMVYNMLKNDIRIGYRRNFMDYIEKYESGEIEMLNMNGIEDHRPFL